MVFKSILAVGALALQTSAFLIPLEVSRAAGIAKANPELKHQTVELDCPDRPFAGVGGDGSTWTLVEDPVSLHLEFDITDDDQFLQINGQPVFPPPRTLIPIALKAEQVRKSDQSHTKPLRLGYAMEVLPTISEVTDISVTPIQFTVLDLHGLVVRVDTVRVDLVRSWGKMHIARITQIPYAESPGANQCTTSICRLRYIVANRLRKMIEAAKAHAGAAKTWIKNGCGGRKHAQAGAESAHKKSHSNVHHRHGRVHHFIKKTVLFFVPAAVFGILFYCLSHRSRSEGARGLEAAVEDDEKDALVENGEMPPQYEDVDVIVVEEK